MKRMTQALLSEDHTWEKQQGKKHPKEEINCNRLIHNIKPQPTAPVPGSDSSFFAYLFCCHHFSSPSLFQCDTKAEPNHPCTQTESVWRSHMGAVVYKWDGKLQTSPWSSSSANLLFAPGFSFSTLICCHVDNNSFRSTVCLSERCIFN